MWVSVSILEAENDPEIRINPDGVEIFQLTGKLMEPIAWHIHLLHCFSSL